MVKWAINIPSRLFLMGAYWILFLLFFIIVSFETFFISGTVIWLFPACSISFGFSNHGNGPNPGKGIDIVDVSFYTRRKKAKQISVNIEILPYYFTGSICCCFYHNLYLVLLIFLSVWRAIGAILICSHDLLEFSLTFRTQLGCLIV